MEWINTDQAKPIMSWCRDVEPGAMRQAENLANHPKIFHHVALMPDCHQGYGMPIGGVIGCFDVVIPYAVGVDIGCGMGAVRTEVLVNDISKNEIRYILNIVKRHVPMGFDVHQTTQAWDGFKRYESLKNARWNSPDIWSRAKRSIGSLGGGNHFIEIQQGDDGHVWLMLHSGSRNLGKVIADYHHKKAVNYCESHHIELPDKQLSYLPADDAMGKAYIHDMTFALEFALENRSRMMKYFKQAFVEVMGKVLFDSEVNIHHNYAAKEVHFGRDLWVHRKGATSARKGQKGIIPGSMGTASYIIEGLGCEDSFNSCSHGAGRAMGRHEACRSLNIADCEKAMKGVVYDGFARISRGKLKGNRDVSEAPLVYKNIEEVVESQKDLIRPLVKLRPLGVIKG